jgi:hypothetical protein
MLTPLRGWRGTGLGDDTDDSMLLSGSPGAVAAQNFWFPYTAAGTGSGDTVVELSNGMTVSVTSLVLLGIGALALVFVMGRRR